MLKNAIAALLFVLLTGMSALTANVSACTRVVYKGPDDTVLTGRTMDFAIDIPANLWIFPGAWSARERWVLTPLDGLRIMEVSWPAHGILLLQMG
jgi:penicillin V acylase-like amidase (Ntn superfamily)